MARAERCEEIIPDLYRLLVLESAKKKEMLDKNLKSIVDV
jgi:hypothetical protein